MLWEYMLAGDCTLAISYPDDSYEFWFNGKWNKSICNFSMMHLNLARNAFTAIDYL